MQRQLGLPKSELPFEELAELRDLTEQLLSLSIESLANYRDSESGGYFHVLDTDLHDTPGTGGEEKNLPGDFSKASTATVVRFLASSGQWLETPENSEKTQPLFDSVVLPGPWTSAMLEDDNPFTVAFLLELAGDLLDLGASPSEEQTQTLVQKLQVLAGHLSTGDGAISIEQRLPNAYLTQLATRVLIGWMHRMKSGTFIVEGEPLPLFDGDLRGRTRVWALSSVDTQIALTSAAPREADVFELGYAVLLVLATSPPYPSPSERRRLSKGLELVFAAQSSDGTWPRSQRLFHYPKYGNAYCYEYEFLTQLLDGMRDDPLLLRPFLPNFRRAVDRLDVEFVRLPGDGYGWMSGHHRQLRWPESWSTASCFNFAFLLDRFVAGAIRDGLLEYLDARPVHPTITPDSAPFEKQLDSWIPTTSGTPLSFKKTMIDRLIQPVIDQRQVLQNGGRLSKETPLSAILYGPPGTSKTTCVEAIAAMIGWPLVSIDPSHLLRNGFADILPEMNRVFRRLEYADNVVIFFDEIDELVRDRFGQCRGECLQVFDDRKGPCLNKLSVRVTLHPASASPMSWPTARVVCTRALMLPKIVRLRATRQRLFFVATNHVEVFDAAIARPGRFDLVVPLMPPTADEKMRHWKISEDHLLGRGINLSNDMKKKLDSLSFAEFDSVSKRLLAAADQNGFETVLDDAAAKGMLASEVSSGATWASLMSSQESKIRLPEPASGSS